MRHLVLGLGEVGMAVLKVLGRTGEEAVGMDKGQKVDGRFGTLHVCFPHSREFERYVKEYVDEFGTDDALVVVHSTVPIGTTERMGAVHSPVRGVHPNLEAGILTFVKYFGGNRAKEAANIFEKVGITCVVTENSRNTEALKLWDTTYYGWNIVFMKAVKAFCDEHELDFNLVYSKANIDYNEGYTELGRPEVVRPVLKYIQGEIGGHCVIPNCHILGGGIADFILKSNEGYAIQRLEH